jgi:hypothetical protein
MLQKPEISTPALEENQEYESEFYLEIELKNKKQQKKSPKGAL